jgi:hypothetical protein
MNEIYFFNFFLSPSDGAPFFSYKRKGSRIQGVEIKIKIERKINSRLRGNDGRET